jgi:hypothetical protein
MEKEEESTSNSPLKEDDKSATTNNEEKKVENEKNETTNVEEAKETRIETQTSTASDQKTIVGEEKEDEEEEKSRRTQRQISSSSNVNNDTTTITTTTTKVTPSSTSASTPTNNSNNRSIMFYGVTYLGCSSVNAPKSETEINRIMCTLNEQAAVVIEVTMSMPQSIDDKIVLYDAKSNGESKIAEYKMSHVLFVVRGGKQSPEAACFAFTTCHGDSVDNLMFSCHVFRCNLVEAVSKILYSFWSVFNRYLTSF